MKHWIISFLLFGFSLGSLKAQIGIGAKLGVNLSTATGLDIPYSESWEDLRIVPKPGVSVGLFGEFRLLRRENVSLFLQTEFAYDEKGYAYQITSKQTGSYEYSISSLDYGQMPISFKLQMGKGKLKGHISVGGYLGLMLSQSIYLESQSEIENDKYDESGMLILDGGVLLGGGVEYQLGPGAIFADLRCTQGLISPWITSGIGNDKEFPHGQDRNSPNQVWNCTPSFSIGYVFRFGRRSKETSTTEKPTSNTNQGSAQPVKNTAPARPEPTTTQLQETTPAPAARPEPKAAAAPTPKPSAQPTEAVVPDPARPDFSAMTEMNKRLLLISDAASSNTQITTEKNAVLARFTNPDAMVTLLKNGVAVEYMTVADLISYIHLNHYRYKITNLRTDANGKITEASATRIN